MGGQGRDLLIGGQGSDTLHGAAGSDLFIAGYTAWDDNTSAMDAISQEWASSRSYSRRQANILGTGRGSRANGNYFLRTSGAKQTVFDDQSLDLLNTGSVGQGLGDWLRGTPGVDWYFANRFGGVTDAVKVQNRHEVVQEMS